MRPVIIPIKPAGDIAVNSASFFHALRAENVSVCTQETYVEAVARLAAFLSERGMPTDVAHIRREHVEAFIAHLLERWKPATPSTPPRLPTPLKQARWEAVQERRRRGLSLAAGPRGVAMPASSTGSFSSVATAAQRAISAPHCGPGALPRALLYRCSQLLTGC